MLLDLLGAQTTSELNCSRDLQSDYSVLNSNIEGIKKEIGEAMQCHEDMTVQRDRTAYDLANCQRSS